MNKYTKVSSMGFNQQLGMATLKTAADALIDFGVSFQITIQETDECITKEFSRLPHKVLKDAEGVCFEGFDFYVTEIVFMLYREGDTIVRFHNGDDEILEVSDRHKALEHILCTFCL